MLALSPHSTAAQAPNGAVKSEVTSPEAVLGVQMGSNRRALNACLVARGWVLVEDSIFTVGSPSLYSGTLAGRPAEVIATFSAWTNRLLNLAMSVPLWGSGVRVGDVLIGMGGVSATDTDFVAEFRRRYAGQSSGTAVPVEVKRGDQVLTLQARLRYASPAPRLMEDSGATPTAVRLRNGILHGVVDR